MIAASARGADDRAVGGTPPDVVVDPDGTRAGRRVRERLDAGARAAGFVGDPVDSAAAVDAFVSDVLRPSAGGRASER